MFWRLWRRALRSNASTTPYTKCRTHLCYTLKKSLLCVRLPRHSMRAADVASTARSMSLGRWFLVACFSSVQNHDVLGPHLFPSFTTRQKNPYATPTTVLQRAKKSLCNRSQFRTLFLPYRFIKIRPSHQQPVSIESLTIWRIPGFPNLSKIEKVAENRDIDGKETLIVKRAIAISKRVLGWTYRSLWRCDHIQRDQNI